MNELLDPCDARAILFAIGRLGVESSEKARELIAAVRLAEMGEVQFTIGREQAGDVGEFPLIDVLVVAIAQIADSFLIAQVLHHIFQFAHTRFEIGSHDWSLLATLHSCSTLWRSPTKAASAALRRLHIRR